MLYYEGYEVPEKDFLEEEELHVLSSYYWMVDNRSTIRETAENCEYSTTTFWRRIHDENYASICPELNSLVLQQIKINIEKRGRRR